MARTFTRSEMRTKLQRLCDIENDNHLQTAELNEALDSAACETLDFLFANGLHDKAIKSQTFSTTSGQIEYPFDTIIPALDFYRLTDLYTVETQGNLRKLQRVNPAEILDFRAPQRSGIQLKAYYLPFRAKSISDSDTFDSINGYEEHTLYTAACAVKFKRDEDYRMFANRKREIEARIRSMANTDVGEPPRVVRKRRTFADPWIYYSGAVNAYAVRGDKLELYYLTGFIPSM